MLTLIEKAYNWLRGKVYPGCPVERLITDKMINQFIKTIKN